MKCGVHRFLMSLPCAAALLFSAPAAEAATIIELATAGCAGVTCGPLAFDGGSLTLTAVGGAFQYKTVNGATGLGVSGRTSGEIDVNESINGAFSSAVLLDAFRIVFIYNGAEFGDPNEIAALSANGGAIHGTLTVGDLDNTASWSLGGSVTSCGDTTTDGTGCFIVFNPFGSSLVSDFSFTAVSAGTIRSNNSDFSLGSLQVTSVPEPASVLLLGTGLLAYVARRRKASSQR